MLVTRCARQARLAKGASFAVTFKSLPSTSSSTADSLMPQPSQELCQSLPANKLRLLRSIQKEYELLRYVCVYIPTTLTDEHYRMLMSISNRNVRAKYLGTLYVAECRRTAAGGNVEMRTKLKRLLTTIAPASATPRLVFDCGRLSELSDSGVDEICQLIADSLIAVLSHEKPWRVTLANCPSSDEIRRRVLGADAVDICSLAVDFIEQSFVYISPEEEDGVVTYLTATKRYEYLPDVRSSDIYVLDVLEGSNFKDRRQDINSVPVRTAMDGIVVRRMPLPLHVDWHGYTVLPLRQSASILLDVHLTNNWRNSIVKNLT